MLRLIPLLALFAFAPALAGTSIYEPAVHELDNGMQVITKERHHAQSTAIRLVVGVGHLHSPCRKQQGAHLLEHLVFAGYDDLTETDINRSIDAMGAYDNAFTGMYETSFVFDTFGPHTLDTVSLLYHLVTRPAPRPDDIDAARKIVESEDRQSAASTRELFGDPDRVQSSMHKGYRHLLGDVLDRQECISMVSKPDLVSRQDLVRLHRTYYVPNNMTLIVVGNFDTEALLSQVAETFGRLDARRLPAPPSKKIEPYAVEPMDFEGSFEFSHAQVMTRTEGYSSPDHYALRLLVDHLDNRMYDIFRIEHPLAYSPEAELSNDFNYGIARLGANVSETEFDTAHELIDQLLQEVKSTPVPADSFRTLQHKAVTANLMQLETNSAVADYYVTSLFELERTGRFVDEAAAIMALTPRDLRRVANTYFREDRLVWLQDQAASDLSGNAAKN